MKFLIKYKLSLIIFVILVPMLFFFFVYYFKMIQHDEHDAKSHNLDIAVGIAGDFDMLIENSFNTLQVLSLHPAVISKDSAECNRLFSALLPLYPEYMNILATGMDGYNYASAVSLPDVRSINYNDTDWFQKAKRGSRVSGDLYISRIFKAPTIMIAMPSVDRSKKQTGIIRMALNLSNISDNISKKWLISDGTSIIVIDSKGSIIAQTADKEKIGSVLRIFPFFKRALEREKGNYEITGDKQEKTLCSFSTVKNTGWTVLVCVPTAKIYQHAYMFNKDYLSLLILVSFLALLLALFFSRRIIRNIHSLITGLKEAEKGNLDFRLDLQGNDELTDVAESFNRTSTVIKNKEEIIMQSESFLSSVLEGIGEGVIVIDRDYRIIMANKGYCDQVKMSCDDIIGMYCYKVSHHSDKPCYENGSSCECTAKQCFEDGEHHRAIHMHYDKNNNQIYIETNAYPLKDASGNIVSAIETLSDVTGRVKLEKRQGSNDEIRESEMRG